MTSVREQLEANAAEFYHQRTIGYPTREQTAPAAFEALRGVLEIHHPVSQNMFAAFPLEDPVDVCSHCNTSRYPCRTAAAIESALTPKEAS